MITNLLIRWLSKKNNNGGTKFFARLNKLWGKLNKCSKDPRKQRSAANRHEKRDKTLIKSSRSSKIDLRMLWMDLLKKLDNPCHRERAKDQWRGNSKRDSKLSQKLQRQRKQRILLSIIFLILFLQVMIRLLKNKKKNKIRKPYSKIIWAKRVAREVNW